MKELQVSCLFDLTHTLAASILSSVTYPWEILDGLKGEIVRLGKTLSAEEFTEILPQVWVAKDVKIADTASITGPCIIDQGAEIRQGAFIRGSAIVGKGCVVGNSTELKNCILFDSVQVPHFNYVGDSVLGYRSHLGAGAVCSNVKSDKTLITVSVQGTKIATGRKKLGALLGDFVEVGCNSVLCPGTVIGKESTVYPLCRVRGFIPPHSICKDGKNITKKQMKQEE